MANNSLIDLNDHLFMALERLNDEDLNLENIDNECKRVASIVSVAEKIIGNAKITLDAMKLVAEGKLETTELTEIFIKEKKQIT